MDIDLILKNLSKSEGWFLKNHSSFHLLIQESNDDEITWREKFYLYLNNLDRPKCYCGNNTKFININSGFRTYCSTKCQANDRNIRDKTKNTCIRKYGSENPMQNDDVKKRLNDSIFKKYGVDNISKLESIKDMKAETMLKKYNVRYNSQRKDLFDKLSNNMRNLNLNLKDKRGLNLNNYWRNKLEKIGVEFLYKKEGSILVIKCSKGHDFDIKNGYLNDRIKWNSTLCTVCNPIIKIEKTIFDNDSFLKKAFLVHKDKYEYLETYRRGQDYINIMCKKCGKIFKQKPNAHLIGNGCIYCSNSVSNKETRWLDKIGIPYKDRQVKITINNVGYNIDGFSKKNNTIYEFYGDYWHGNPNVYNSLEMNKTIGKSFGELYEKTINRENIFKSNGYNIISIWENDFNKKNVKNNSFIKFIRSIYNGDIIENYYNNCDLDIFIPNENMSISLNSIENNNKNYYRDKYLYYKSKDIRLINIWEDDWVDKNSIICSQIRYLLKCEGIESIYARKCSISKITQKEAKYFLDTNHLQGYASGVYSIGLFHNDDLISVMNFDNTEGRRMMESNGWNLNRFSSKTGLSIIGGFSKMLKYFIKNVNPHRIISYADLSWSNGDIYFKSNFKLIGMVNPDYKWVFFGKKYNKQKFKKSNLIKMGYDKNKSESEIMIDNDSFKIWDCGKLKFEMIF